MKRSLILTVTIILILLFATTGCFNLKKNVQTIEFTKNDVPIPYLNVKINGINYETDEQGYVAINKEASIEKVETADPYEVIKVKRDEEMSEVRIDYTDEKYAGYVYEKTDEKSIMKLVLLNMPQAKGVEVIQNPEMKKTINEEAIEFNKQSEMMNEILKMSIERKGEKIVVYALLRKEGKKEVVLEEMEVENKIKPDTLNIKVVDKNGESVYESKVSE